MVQAEKVQAEWQRLLREGGLMLVYVPGIGVATAPATVVANVANATVRRSRAGVSALRQRHLSPDLTVKQAAAIFQRSQRLAKPTRRRNACYWRRVLEHFGRKRLCDVTADALWDYQEARLDEAGAVTINHELSQLKQLLDAAGLWARLKDNYKRLRERPSNVGRPLSSQQEEKLFAAARGKEEWEVAYLVALLAKNTLLSPSEIFALRLGDADIAERTVRVTSGKNQFRPRVVPLNRDALHAVKQMLKLARAKAGANLPSHFLLPYGGRTGQRFDPTQPARGCRTAWRSLTRAVGLRGLRIKDMRHHGTTVLDERGVSERVTKQLLGHSPNSHIIETYSHPRIQAKRAAVKMLERKRSG